MASNYFTLWADNVTEFKGSDMNSPLSELDRAITYNRPAIVSCDGDVTWDSATSTLAWSGALRIIFNRADGTAILNTVSAGSVVIADNQFAKVTLSEYNETALTVSAATANPGAASNFLDPAVFVLAYRNTTSDKLTSIGLGDLLVGASALDGRVDALEAEVSGARGGEASLDDRLDTMETNIGAAGTGSVTSVGLTLPTDLFEVSGSPVVDSGTLAGTLKVQNANKFLAGPASGADAAPTMRELTEDDLPSLPFTLPVYVPGTYTAAQLLAPVSPTFACSIPADLAGTTVAVKGANPTASAVISLEKNGTEFGTITIATDGTATLASTSGATFNGTTDYLDIFAPASADTTLAGVSINLAMTRG